MPLSSVTTIVIFHEKSILFFHKNRNSPAIVVLLDKSIPVQRRTNGKFMLVWKNNMLFLGKMTIDIVIAVTPDKGILLNDTCRRNFSFYKERCALFKRNSYK
jgi:hypothetical protein